MHYGAVKWWKFVFSIHTLDSIQHFSIFFFFFLTFKIRMTTSFLSCFWTNERYFFSRIITSACVFLLWCDILLGFYLLFSQKILILISALLSICEFYLWESGMPSRKITPKFRLYCSLFYEWVVVQGFENHISKAKYNMNSYSNKAL